MLTKFYAELFQSLGSPVLEIHSRKSQSARTKAADAFRTGSQARSWRQPYCLTAGPSQAKAVHIVSPSPALLSRAAYVSCIGLI